MDHVRTGPTLAAFLELAKGRRGHFRIESGHHSALWLDLDALFAEPRAIEPFVAALTSRLRSYSVDAVCGPLLGGAFLAQLVAQALGVTFCFAERRATSTPGLYGARYEIPSAYQGRLSGRRVALVDDVMSAGSALRGTLGALEAAGAIPVVAGALLVLGDLGVAFFAQRNLPLAMVVRDDYELWTAEACPLCIARHPLEDLTSPAA